MEGIDPDTLLEWLQAGFGDERDLQVSQMESRLLVIEYTWIQIWDRTIEIHSTSLFTSILKNTNGQILWK